MTCACDRLAVDLGAGIIELSLEGFVAGVPMMGADVLGVRVLRVPR